MATPPTNSGHAPSGPAAPESRRDSALYRIGTAATSSDNEDEDAVPHHADEGGGSYISIHEGTTDGHTAHPLGEHETADEEAGVESSTWYGGIVEAGSYAPVSQAISAPPNIPPLPGPLHQPRAIHAATRFIVDPNTLAHLHANHRAITHLQLGAHVLDAISAQVAETRQHLITPPPIGTPAPPSHLPTAIFHNGLLVGIQPQNSGAASPAPWNLPTLGRMHASLHPNPSADSGGPVRSLIAAPPAAPTHTNIPNSGGRAPAVAPSFGEQLIELLSVHPLRNRFINCFPAFIQDPPAATDSQTQDGQTSNLPQPVARISERRIIGCGVHFQDGVQYCGYPQHAFTMNLALEQLSASNPRVQEGDDLISLIFALQALITTAHMNGTLFTNRGGA